MDAGNRHSLTTPARLSQALLQHAAQGRAGLVPAVHDVPAPACELPGLANAAVPAEPNQPWQTVSGAVGATPAQARTAALAEALERMAAAQARFAVTARRDLPAEPRILDTADAFFTDGQRAQAGFPWPTGIHGDDRFAEVFRLTDNARHWAPQECVGLGPRVGEPRMPSTSSGLAAHRDAAGGPWLALLRAAQEVLERDALTVTWLHGLGGREIPVPRALADAVAHRGGCVHAFDLTQVWNPHPVIAVAGSLPQEGRMRHCLGVACRADRTSALTKAAEEWQQSLAFAGHVWRTRGMTLPSEPHALRQFDEHAAFYTVRPTLWAQTALMAHRHPASMAGDAVPAAPGATRAEPAPAASAGIQNRLDAPLPPGSADTARRLLHIENVPTIPVSTHPAALDEGADSARLLHALVQTLAAAGIDLFYRELTPPDVAQTGLRVMRVIAPALASLHADERAPFLGGRCADVAWRYPGATSHTPFPNPLPHPLG